MKKILCSLLSLTSVLLLITGCATRVEPELRQAVDRKLAVQRSVELDCEKPTSPFCAVQSPLIYLGSVDTLKDQQHAALVEIGENAPKAQLHLIRGHQQEAADAGDPDLLVPGVHYTCSMNALSGLRNRGLKK